MNLEIEVIAREVVTPSSPIHHHSDNYKLSFLDQTMAPFFTTAYFFYPANNDNIISNAQRSNNLKKSLSRVLTLFYPLAGRLVGNTYVNCNDEGVTFVEARANGTLSDVLTNPNPEDFVRLFPCDPDDAKDLCMIVQATFFDCGGLALGLGISHKVVDGFSYVMFLNSWASFSRGDCQVKSPNFESSILFPPEDLVREIVLTEKKENMVCKKFVFTTEKITALRNKYTKNTRIETLTAFIGNRFIVATGKVFALRIFVDIRSRVVPPLTEYHFGNIVIPAITMPSLEEDEDDTHGIVKKLRDAIGNVNGNSVEKIRKENNSNNMTDMLTFTNTCNFPVHEANFGWGVPIFVGGPNIPVNNMVYFSDSLSGGGIDVWVNMKEEDMAKFEADKEFHKYIS